MSYVHYALTAQSLGTNSTNISHFERDKDMRTLDEMTDYNFEAIDGRDRCRIARFLPLDKLECVGVDLEDGATHIQKEWTELEIVKQLLSDAEFGREKAEDERGISSSIMADVCAMWLFALEDTDVRPTHRGYNLEFYEQIIDKYSGLVQKIDEGEPINKGLDKC